MSKGKILVTGGMGYIGSHTIIDLLEEGYEPISIDNGINSNFKAIDRIKEIKDVDITNYNIDLCNLEATKSVFKQHEFKGIIHFAALKAVGESTQKPILYFKNNMESLLNVLACVKEFNVPNFIYSSSCTVYGNVDESPVDESTPLQEAESPYGRTKQMGEDVIKDTFKMLESKAILLRYFNPGGAHPSGKIGEDPIVLALNLIPAITETALGKREKMTVFGSDYNTRDGSCVRDYIHVCDLARAHTLALNHLVSGNQEQEVDVYNLGIGTGVTVLEAIKSFEKVSRKKLNYEIGPRRSGDVIAIYADPGKARNKLGWTPRYGIEEIMDSAWKWEQQR